MFHTLVPSRKRAGLSSDKVSADLRVKSRAEEGFLALNKWSICEETQSSATKVVPGPKDAATEAAMQAVFQTNELVENILVHLPAKTIFGAKRVCKSFKNAVEKSLPIREKLFLSVQTKSVTKVMAYGCQHTAAVLNPLFVPGTTPGNYTVHNSRLSSRSNHETRYGITVAHDCRISMESSILDTYLFDVPIRKLRLSLRFWVGDNGPTVIIDEAGVGAGNAMSIRAMINSVLERPRHIGLAFDENMWRRLNARYPKGYTPHAPTQGSVDTALRAHHFRVEASYRSQQNGINRTRERFIPALGPNDMDQMVHSLRVAKRTGKEAIWGFDTYAKPSEILRNLQVFAGVGSKIYISLSQSPTFLLHDVVIPSPKDWAEIEARSG